MTAAKATTKTAAKKRVRPSRAVQKATVSKVENVEVKVPATKKEKVEGEKKVNKMATAIVVFEKMTKAGKARKEIIQAFIDQVHLTKAGASTYYQSIKNME